VEPWTGGGCAIAKRNSFRRLRLSAWSVDRLQVTIAMASDPGRRARSSKPFIVVAFPVHFGTLHEISVYCMESDREFAGRACPASNGYHRPVQNGVESDVSFQLADISIMSWMWIDSGSVYSTRSIS
jgi:hypothetical protein